MSQWAGTLSTGEQSQRGAGMRTQLREQKIDALWFPSGPEIRYACRTCRSTLASVAQEPASCACGNVRIDSGRVSLQDKAQFCVVMEVSRSALIRPCMPAWSPGMSVNALLNDLD